MGHGKRADERKGTCSALAGTEDMSRWPNKRHAVDAGWRLLFAVEHHRPGATHAERYPEAPEFA